MNRKVVLVGWDLADWRVLDPLLDAGELPALSSLIETGVRGELESLTPMVSPTIWTTLITGHHCEKHGVLGYREVDPSTGRLRRASAHARKVKALWTILTEAGKRSIALNWPASHPAEAIAGVAVSDLFAAVAGTDASNWPLQPGAVYPATIAEQLAELRLHPSEFSLQDLSAFVSGVDQVDRRQDLRPAQLATELAEAVSVHAAATWLMEQEPWDCLAVRYGSAENRSHRMADGEGEISQYRDVVPSVYRFYDMMLRRLIDLAGPEATFVVVSDRGSAGRTANQQVPGIFCAAGPGLRRDELIFGTRVVDVTPFVLTLFGLPAGLDMPGHAPAQAFVEAPEIRRIASWEESGGVGSRENTEALRQLADLGYVEQLSPEHSENLEKIRAQDDEHLAQSLVGRQRYAEAIPVLKRSIARRPDTGTRLMLANCYLLSGRVAEGKQLLEDLPEPHAPEVLLLRGRVAVAEGRSGEALVMLEEAAKRAEPDVWFHFRRARVYVALQRWEDAEQGFRKALEYGPEAEAVRTELARALFYQGKREAAAEQALAAIRLRYSSWGAHLILGAALAGLGQIERAAEALETSLQFRPTSTAHEWLAAIAEQSLQDAERAAWHRERARSLPSAMR